MRRRRDIQARTTVNARSFCRRSIALLALIAYASQADERILRYHSDIEIAADGSMTVTETIRVVAERDRIQRGIYRDFPTRYRDEYGNRLVVDFDVLAVTRNGDPEPYFTEGRANGVRVYVGSRDRLLDPGEHEYAIRYRTDWQLGFYEDHDELYWNVTGNGWEFPIDAASARVVLPVAAGAENMTIEGYVGLFGSRGQSIAAEIDGDASATIRATRALSPREGLTLVLTWPKGVVEAPTAGDRLWRLVSNNRGLLIALIVLALSFGYWLKVWNAFGRDPEAGPIFPHYEPPPDISPASARHVSRMGYDQKAFSAALINLAVKGYVEIDEDDGDYTLRRTEGGTQRLAPGEAVLLRELFAAGDRVELDNDNHAVIGAAMRHHGKALKRDNYRIYFRTNGIYTLPAVALLVIGFVAILAVNGITPLAVVTLIVTAVLIPIFAFLMRAHTPAGRKLLDKIEGFKLYLDVAEKDELNLRNPPEITPALFEAYLPYALALGVEQRWAERFNASLTTREAADYRPAWYHGSWHASRSGSNIGSMTAAMTGAVTSAIASAATPPGSSSGSGGGGFSGGGGGGGGGGGW
ncbi:MAG: DUF2207 domain-containing protein [Gammaproteobacteria bacterium]|nr:DUF2207 domain-containing protein [Gammaproteobacteria bacterium]